MVANLMHMIFNQPYFLFGLLAVAIPVIIHLFNFRKVKKIYFTNTQFIQDVKQQRQPKKTLKHLLVLLFRVLFISFLVLAFAQPFLPSQEKGLSNNEVYIYLDNSFSMSSIQQEKKRIDHAIQYVEEITSLYPKSTTFKILTNEFDARFNSFKQKTEVEELLSEVTLCPVSRTLEEVIGKLKLDMAINRQNKPSDIFLISDFQKSTFASAQQEDTANHYYVIPIISEEPYSNVYVDSVSLKRPYLLASEDNELLVMLRKIGESDAREYNLKIYINDMQVGASSVDFEGNMFKTVPFTINNNLLKKINTGKISIEDYPITFDNDFWFTLNTTDKIPIVELKSTQQVTSVEKVYANESLFDFTSFHINNVDYQALSNYKLLILNGLNEWDNTLNRPIFEFIGNGGKAVLIPGDQPNLNLYNSLTQANISLNQDTTKLPLSPVESSNPFYDGVFKDQNKPFTMPVARSAVNWKSFQQLILAHKNNTPYIAGLNSNLYLFGSPLNEKYTNFHQHALFVPIMYKIAASSVQSSDKLYYYIDQPNVRIRLDSSHSQRSIYKFVNDQIEIIPQQRHLNNQLSLDLPKNSILAGVYHLTLNDHNIKGVAFNYNHIESDLTQHNSNDIASLMGATKLTLFESQTPKIFANDMKLKYFGRQLWRHALVLALMCLVGEVVIIRFWK